MMKVDKVVGLIRKMKVHGNGDKKLFEFLSAIADGSGKPSPVTYEGRYLSELSDAFSPLLKGLKDPKVTLGMKSSRPGQGLFGLVIKDRNTVVSKFALAIDSTRGELPIIQSKGNLRNAGERVCGFSIFYNPNIELNPETCGSAMKKMQGGARVSSEYFDDSMRRALSADIYIDKNALKDLDAGGQILKSHSKMRELKPEEINNGAGYLRAFMQNSGNRVVPLNELMDDVVKIARMKGRPTIESVQKSAQNLLKKMGYDHTIVKVSEADCNGGAMSFNQLTGEIHVEPRFFEGATHQDVAVILSHELTHMEDFIRLYKTIGAERFEKLVRPIELVDENVPELNHEWYKKMAKYVDEKQWKWNIGIQRTIVKDSDGKIIERRNHQAFNAKTMIKELKEKIKYEIARRKNEYTGIYAEIKAQEEYQMSAIEEHARLMEENIINILKDKGIYRETELSSLCAKGPYDYLGRYKSEFTPIDKYLNRFKGKKSEEFSRLYYEVLGDYDKDLAKLVKKLNTEGGLLREDFDKMNSLIKQRFEDEKSMQSAILHTIRYRLREFIPSAG